MEQNESENVDRGRIVDDYKHSIIQSVEHDENNPGTWSSEEARDSQALREQYNERSHQLDENEATAKEQYDNNHCEEVTGLSSDGYRRQVIEDYTHEKMAGNQAEANQSGDYWDASGKGCGEGAAADNQNSTQNEQADYWATGNANEGSTSEIENGNEKTNEASC